MEPVATETPKDPIKLERARERLSHNSAQQGMARLRKALCDPARLQIVEALTAGELCVNDIALAITRAPAATSQHLRVLRNLGFLDSRREGTTVYYRLKAGAATQLQTVLHTLASVPDEATA